MTITQMIIGIMIPLFGTVAGAGTIFFIKGEIKPGIQKAMLGFASGVMIAASVWSLIIPGINMAEEQGMIPWIPAAVGFLLGMGFLLLLDNVIPHFHMSANSAEGRRSSKLGKSAMLILAVTLHNFPEGMAVGVVYAGAQSGSAILSAASAFALSAGIALQNFPEGAVISMPLAVNGMNKKKAFLYGASSGIVEPIGAVLTIMLTSLIVPVLPYILSFAAGAMIYVVVEDLIPEFTSGSHSNIGTIGVALGFTLMMVLDIALG